MKNLLISVVIGGIVILSIVLFLIHRNVQPLFGEDSLSVKVESPLNAERIKIEYGFNSINRKSDAELFKSRERYSVLYDGEKKGSLKTEYGENDFLVTYDDKYYLSFRQFKTWRKSYHSYSFNIYKEDSVPILKVDIEGDNKIKFDMPMIPIEFAEQYLMNVAIDSASISSDSIIKEK